MNHSEVHRTGGIGATLLAISLGASPSAAEEKQPTDVQVRPVFSANIAAMVNSAVLRVGMQTEGGDEKKTRSGNIAPRNFFELGAGLRLSDEFTLGATGHFADAGEKWIQSFGPEMRIQTGTPNEYFRLRGDATFTGEGLASALAEMRVRGESGFILGLKTEGDVDHERFSQRWCVGPNVGYGPKKWPVEGTIGLQSCDSGAPEGELDDMRVVFGVEATVGK